MKSRSWCLFALSLWVVCSVYAQPYPNKPIKFVVGYPPGGSGDFVTRTLGEAIAAELGQSAVIDNRPGAAGNLASEVVNKSPADGSPCWSLATPTSTKRCTKNCPMTLKRISSLSPCWATGPWWSRLTAVCP